MNNPLTFLDDESLATLETAAPVEEDPLMLDNVFTLLGAIPKYLDDNNAQPSTPEVPSQSTDEMWIIHIDDDLDLAEALRAKMEARGIRVVHALDGSTGVRTVFEHPANAIILDYEMPNGRGDFVLRRLKNNPVTRDIPVILLSGVANNAVKRQLLGMGAHAFIDKPYEFDELYQLVTDLRE